MKGVLVVSFPDSLSVMGVSERVQYGKLTNRWLELFAGVRNETASWVGRL